MSCRVKIKGINELVLKMDYWRQVLLLRSHSSHQFWGPTLEITSQKMTWVSSSNGQSCDSMCLLSFS